MKQIIPFQKELLFKTKVSEITSISLEHSFSEKNSDCLSGNFLISGDYKMTEGSINREKFNFDIPFEIALDGRYDINTVNMDIDNFYYEVINDEILKVNIDVYVIGDLNDNNNKLLDNNDRREEGEESDIDVSLNNDNEFNNNNDIDVGTSSLDDYESNKSVDYDNSSLDKDDEFNCNIFDNIDSGDTYVTYYVYIVKEDDDLDKIMKKFNVSREELSKYNDLSDIHEKVKLIIPNSNE